MEFSSTPDPARCSSITAKAVEDIGKEAERQGRVCVCVSAPLRVRVVCGVRMRARALNERVFVYAHL